MSKVVATAALLGIGLVAGGRAAHAQTPVNPLLPTKGTREIGLSGNIVFDPVNSQDINLLYGMFLNPNLEVGGQFSYFNPDKGDDSFGLSVFADYHFPSASPLLPFIGVNVGFTDTTDTNFSYGARAGVKYFLNPNVSANAAFQWTHVEDVDDDDTRITLGLSVYLR
jgi:hypothetical protein